MAVVDCLYLSGDLLRVLGILMLGVKLQVAISGHGVVVLESNLLVHDRCTDIYYSCSCYLLSFTELFILHWRNQWWVGEHNATTSHQGKHQYRYYYYYSLHFSFRPLFL